VRDYHDSTAGRRVKGLGGERGGERKGMGRRSEQDYKYMAGKITMGTIDCLGDGRCNC